MVSDLIFCGMFALSITLMVIRFAQLNISNKWYGVGILLLEFFGIMMVCYFILLLYKIFTGN